MELQPCESASRLDIYDQYHEENSRNKQYFIQKNSIILILMC